MPRWRLRLPRGPGPLYPDLEAREDGAKLSDPALFLRARENRLVILDEIHRVPELFQTLRGVIATKCTSRLAEEFLDARGSHRRVEPAFERVDI
jgi:hypothetical protein